jgi:hypothetical protein
MTPEGHSPEYFYQNPGNLVQELGHMDETNLFLVRECEALETQIERDFKRVDADINVTEEGLAEMQTLNEKIPVLSEFTDTLNEGSIKLSERIEEEFVFLTGKICETHERCIGNTRGMPALLMLERIVCETTVCGGKAEEKR